MPDSYTMKPYSWIPDNEVSEYATKLNELRALPSSGVGGGTVEVNGENVRVKNMPTIAKSAVNPEWERELSDVLFRVSGFSQFFSSLAFQCQYLWSIDVPTAGALSKGGKFYVLINPLFFMDYLKKGAYRAFVVVHEVWHIFYDHGMRGAEQGYDPSLFNTACDFYIHQCMERMIKQGAKTGTVEMLPEDVFKICHDAKYAGMTEDEIYQSLLEKQKNQKNGGGSGGQGQAAFDANPDVAEDEGSSSTANSQAIASAVRAAAVQASRNKNAGGAELGIIRDFLEMTEPKVDWRDEFSEFFERVRDGDDRPTYSIYNRRSTEDMIIPSQDAVKIKVGFGIDTSGSMSAEDLTEAMSELQGIIDQVGTWEVDVVSADTKAHPIASLSSENEDDLSSIQLQGGGGTRMGVMVDHFQQEWGDDAYNVMVIFTDGYLMEGDIIEQYEWEIPLIVVVTRKGRVPEWLAEEVKVIQINH